tara:strand:- start:678 stop:1190 length:513 start_codon:yes stop_codon:yes gene_type:complete
MKIAIHGPMCSGKTTVSNIIKKYDPEYKTYSFGGKVKDIGRDLFNMQGKDRSLLIDIASKMREIDNNIWAKYVIKQIKLENNDKCIIDDLRFQNEADYLDGWRFISLTTPKDVRIQRIRNLYKEDYNDHIKNMDHISETGKIKLPENTVYIDGSIKYSELEDKIKDVLKY